MSKISVIIPVYKVEKYLDKCIKSVVNQTFTDLEIILIDDGSPDRCPEICEQWAKKDSRIVVIHKKNGGLSDARNAGLNIATGEFISFVDSDDWIAKNMYEIMLNYLKREKADVCACGILACYPDKQIPMPVNSIVGNSHDIFLQLYTDARYPVAAWNKLYKSKCWSNLRFPKGKICEDAFTTYKIIDTADRIVQIKDNLYFYRIRSNSIMTSEFNINRMDEEEAWRMNYEFIEKKYPDLKKPAYDFYLQRVERLIRAIPISEKNKYRDEYSYLYNILKKNVLYITLFSDLNFKYRVRFLLDFLKL